jgi:hypothetical protein
MTRKKIIIAAIVSAAVIMAGGGGVYAYNYHQEQVEQEKQKQIEEEEREKERLKQEEEKRLREEEEKRLQDARAEIEKELEGINTEVATLYSDDQKKMPADGITQDQIDSVSANIESFKEKYKENKDITKKQNGDLQEMEKEVRFASLMNEVVTKYNSCLYPNGQLVAPKTETDETVTTLKDKLKELEGNKPDFFQAYSEKLSEAESSFAFQRSVLEAVNMIYNKEAGSMIAGVTRQQYNDVLVAVETMPDNELKAELRQYLIVVDQTLTAQEEASKTQKASSGNNSGNGSSSSGSSSSNRNKTSSGGNSSSGSGSSGSKGSSGNGSSGSRNSSSGNSSSGSSNGGSSSSGSGSSSGGNNSSGSGSSGSSNSSSGNGSSGGGNNSSGNNDSDGHGSWEGTIIGGGQTNDGGTVQWGTW